MWDILIGKIICLITRKHNWVKNKAGYLTCTRCFDFKLIKSKRRKNEQ